MSGRDELERQQSLPTVREGRSDRPLPSERVITSPPADDAPLGRGSTVDRYVILDELGRGGMGIVYSAYDPELDRKVAIKLLQPMESDTGEQWLLREAQALAKLSHPNVVAVHDVGTLSGGRVFVAIELVDGETLRAWWSAKRSWREIREVMRAAGAGLAAAHAGGLVHRDFKPDNVLVGKDGRVRVMDFGLARLAPGSRFPSQPAEAKRTLDADLTLAGSVVGTPGYMAPEIYNGTPADARSDQFSFGVTLYNMLYGKRPWPAESFESSLPKGAPAEPPRARAAPARLHRIAMRAIMLDPAQRFPSMTAIVDELSVETMSTRNKVAIVAGATCVAGALAIGAVALHGRSGDEETLLCKGAERHLAGVWDASVRDAVRAAFARSGRQFHERTFASVSGVLDRYTSSWVAAATDNCEATRLRGEQSEAVMTLRTECLDQQRAVVAAFTRQLAAADETVVDRAGNGAITLERQLAIAECADVTALQAPVRVPRELQPRVGVLRQRLADAQASIFIGNFGRTINLVLEVLKEAEPLRFDPVIAEAQLHRGVATLLLGNGPDAIGSLSEAVWAGLRGKRDDLAAQAALFAAQVAFELLGEKRDARIWLGFAKSALARRDAPFAQIRALQMEGVLAMGESQFAASIAAHRAAHAKAVDAQGDTSPGAADTAYGLGIAMTAAGDCAGALPFLERALKITIDWLGAEHPDVATMHGAIGSCRGRTGDVEGGRRDMGRAIEIRERLFGSESPLLITTLSNTADLLNETGDPAGALPLVIRARKLALRLGKGHPNYVSVTSTHGEVLLASGDVANARAAIEEALAVAEPAKSIYLPAVLIARAALARAEKKWDESIRFDERALALYEASSSVERWRAHAGLGLAHAGRGDAKQARTHLEQAIRVAESTRVISVTLKKARTALAAL